MCIRDRLLTSFGGDFAAVQNGAAGEDAGAQAASSGTQDAAGETDDAEDADGTEQSGDDMGVFSAEDTATTVSYTHLRGIGLVAHFGRFAAYGLPRLSADAVSYTHLDVYKRQGIRACGASLRKSAEPAPPERGTRKKRVEHSTRFRPLKRAKRQKKRLGKKFEKGVVLSLIHI